MECPRWTWPNLTFTITRFSVQNKIAFKSGIRRWGQNGFDHILEYVQCSILNIETRRKNPGRAGTLKVMTFKRGYSQYDGMKKCNFSIKDTKFNFFFILLRTCVLVINNVFVTCYHEFQIYEFFKQGKILLLRSTLQMYL